MMMIKVFLVLCFYIQLTENLSINNNNSLTKRDCNYKDGRWGSIDLTYVGLKHGVPAFRHVPADDYFYSYNPCYPFSEESSSCFDVAICQISRDGSTYYNLGMNSLVSWSITVDGKASLIYATIERQTIVYLECSDEMDQLVINGEFDLKRYNLTLFSKCACWNGC